MIEGIEKMEQELHIDHEKSHNFHLRQFCESVELRITPSVLISPNRH